MAGHDRASDSERTPDNDAPRRATAQAKEADATLAGAGTAPARAVAPDATRSPDAASLGARQVKAKSVTGAASDPAEREADREAGQVMRMAAPEQNRPSAVDPAVADASSWEPGRATAVPPEPQRPAAGTVPGPAAAAAPGPIRRQAVPDHDPHDGKEVPEETQRYLDRSQGTGSPLPDGTRRYFEDRFSADFGGVRVHDDNEADRAARSIGALAATRGSDIWFSAGTYDTVTGGGRQLLAHELAHIAQHYPGIGRQADERAGTAGPTNPDYVNEHSARILAAIAERIAAVGVPQPHPRLSWALDPVDVAQTIGAAIYDYVRAVPGTDLKRLMMLSYPADLFALIDHARRGPDGTRREAVTIAIATAFDEPLMTSIRRMGTRLCVQLDIRRGIRPDASSLVASSPLDGLIAEVLVKPGVTGYTPKKKGAADDTGGRPFAKGARVVKYEWQGARDPNLWNWIKVTSPTDATAEDVANTALAGGEAGDVEQAYRIAVSPPYFGIPFETARLIPEAEKFAPTDLRIKLQTGPGPRVADPSVLGRSAVSDDAALVQAPVPTKEDLPLDRGLDRVDYQLAFMQTRLAPWDVATPLLGAIEFVQRRRADLAHDRKSAHRWVPAVAAQQQILKAAASEVAEILNDVTGGKLGKQEAGPDDAAGLGPVVLLLKAYARAGGVSHLHAEAPAALAEARSLRYLLPLALAEAGIEGARAQISEQRDVEMGAESPEAGADKTLKSLPDLMTRSANMRLKAAQGVKLDPDDVEQLSVDASEANLRAYLLTLATKARTLKRQADDVGLDPGRHPSGAWSVQMVMDEILKRIGSETDSFDVWRGWIHDLDEARNWTGLHISGLSPKQTRIEKMRRTIRTVTLDLSTFKDELKIKETFDWALEMITDQKTRNLINSLALQIGVMIVTGEIIGAGAAAIRGIALAGEIGAELRGASLLYKGGELIATAAANTGVQAALGEHVGGRDFAENALGIVLTSAALKPFQGLLRDSAAVEGEIRTWGQLAKRGGRAATELVIETGAGIGAAGVAHAITHGGEMSAMGTEQWVTQGISIVAGRFVHQSTIKMHDRIEVAAHDLKTKSFDELLAKVERLGTRAAKKNHSPDEALSLLTERYNLLVEERKLYDSHPEAKKAHTEAEADLSKTGERFVDVPLQLAHLSPVVEGQIYEGTAAQIKYALNAASALGVPMTPVGPPQSGVWRVGNRTLEIHEIGGSKPAPGGVPAIPGRDFYTPTAGHPLTYEQSGVPPMFREDAMLTGGFEPRSRLVANISSGDSGFIGGVLGETQGLHVETIPSQRKARQGGWSGPEGDSDFTPNDDHAWQRANFRPIPYRNGFPDFRGFAEAEVLLTRDQLAIRDRDLHNRLADRQLALQERWLLPNGQPDVARATAFRTDPHDPLTWHHVEGENVLLLVPRPIHEVAQHEGGYSLPTIP